MAKNSIFRRFMEYSINSENLLNFAYEIYLKLRDRKSPVFLCVGSDKFVSDSLGPIVAELLRHKYSVDTYVYGGLDYNVNGNNLVEVASYIETMHEGGTIILIDATLDKNIGNVRVSQGAFAGMGRVLPNKKIGNISILGVVGRKLSNFNLNSTRLKLVCDMAEFIAKGCFLAINRIKREGANKNTA